MNLPTLDYHRLQEDLVQVYELTGIRDMYDIDASSLSFLTTGNTKKLWPQTNQEMLTLLKQAVFLSLRNQPMEAALQLMWFCLAH